MTELFGVVPAPLVSAVRISPHLGLLAVVLEFAQDVHLVLLLVVGAAQQVLRTVHHFANSEHVEDGKRFELLICLITLTDFLEQNSHLGVLEIYEWWPFVLLSTFTRVDALRGS